MSRAVICRRLELTGVVPVVRARNTEQAWVACRALAAGGVDVLEITMTVPGATELIRELVREFGDKMLVGAGTVLDPQTAVACIAAGAEFIVSPGFDPEIVRVTQEAEKAALPGALTPTEVMAALRVGCRHHQGVPRFCHGWRGLPACIARTLCAGSISADRRRQRADSPRFHRGGRGRSGGWLRAHRSWRAGARGWRADHAAGT